MIFFLRLTVFPRSQYQLVICSRILPHPYGPIIWRCNSQVCSWSSNGENHSSKRKMKLSSSSSFSNPLYRISPTPNRFNDLLLAKTIIFSIIWPLSLCLVSPHQLQNLILDKQIKTTPILLRQSTSGYETSPIIKRIQCVCPYAKLIRVILNIYVRTFKVMWFQSKLYLRKII